MQLGISSGGPRLAPNGDELLDGTTASVAANTSLHAAAMLAKESVIPNAHRQQAISEKEKKM